MANRTWPFGSAGGGARSGIEGVISLQMDVIEGAIDHVNVANCPLEPRHLQANRQSTTPWRSRLDEAISLQGGGTGGANGHAYVAIRSPSTPAR